jgi:transcriptional regulator with XRE-family HTH domain
LTLATLGGELRARREAAGLTRAGLAGAAGTRPVLVGRWERGEALPTPEQVARLAEVLELDPATAADWTARVLPVLPEPLPAGPLPGEAPVARSPWRRLGGRLLSWWRARRSPGEGPAGEDQAGPSAGSYLGDPVERRRYALRAALTLAALAALAIGLVWALLELREGWGAFLDLFRSRPPGTDAAGALVELAVQ